MEKGYRDFGHDIDNTDCPLEVGLGFALALDKPGGFVGREAVLARREAANRAARRDGPAAGAGAGARPRAAAVPRRGGAPRRRAGRLRPGRVVRLDARLGGRAGDGVRRRRAGRPPDWLASGAWEVDVAGTRHAGRRCRCGRCTTRPARTRRGPWRRGLPPTPSSRPAAGSRRPVLLGVTGAPGAGKSRLAAALAARRRCRWCRWTASTSPTWSWRGAGCWTARARRRPSTHWGYAALLGSAARGPGGRGAGAGVRARPGAAARRARSRCRPAGRW